MDSRGHIHMLDDAGAFERLQRGDLVPVPPQFEIAALQAFETGTPIFHSRNRRAAAWGRHSAKLLMQTAKKRRRNRKANKSARVARRARRA